MIVRQLSSALFSLQKLLIDEELVLIFLVLRLSIYSTRGIRASKVEIKRLIAIVLVGGFLTKPKVVLKLIRLIMIIKFVVRELIFRLKRDLLHIRRTLHRNHLIFIFIWEVRS